LELLRGHDMARGERRKKGHGRSRGVGGIRFFWQKISHPVETDSYFPRAAAQNSTERQPGTSKYDRHRACKSLDQAPRALALNWLVAAWGTAGPCRPHEDLRRLMSWRIQIGALTIQRRGSGD
jgi:hypothetical protein